MRKKVLRVALMAAVVAVAGYGVYANQTKGQTMSDIMLKDAEKVQTIDLTSQREDNPENCLHFRAENHLQKR